MLSTKGEEDTVSLGSPLYNSAVTQSGGSVVFLKSDGNLTTPEDGTDSKRLKFLYLKFKKKM